MKKTFGLILLMTLCICIANVSHSAEKTNVTKFQQYEQQDKDYSNPKGYMLPPVMYGTVPYGYNMPYGGGYNNYYGYGNYSNGSLGYNSDCYNKQNYNNSVYQYYSSVPTIMPYVWFNPADFAGDEYNYSQRKSKSTLVKPSEYKVRE